VKHNLKQKLKFQPAVRGGDQTRTKFLASAIQSALHWKISVENIVHSKLQSLNKGVIVSESTTDKTDHFTLLRRNALNNKSMVTLNEAASRIMLLLFLLFSASFGSGFSSQLMFSIIFKVVILLLT